MGFLSVWAMFFQGLEFDGFRSSWANGKHCCSYVQTLHSKWLASPQVEQVTLYAERG